MSSTSKQPEIIDLTMPTPPPEPIELDSDGEVVNPTALANPAALANAISALGQQEKRKRRKRSRRSTNLKSPQDVEEGEIAGSSAELPTREPSHEREDRNMDRNTDRRRENESSRRSLLERLGGDTIGNASADVPRSSRKDRSGKRKRRDSRSPAPERERERDRNRDHVRDHRRSRSRDKRRHDKEPSKPSIKDDALFFEDVKPAEVPIAAHLVVAPTVNVVEGTSTSTSTNPPLLLPPHVSVFGEDGVDPVEIHAPSPPGSDEEDYIEYLDYDDDRRAPGMVRYFELEKAAAEEARAAKPVRVVCKNCGAEGDHKTYECPVLIVMPDMRCARRALDAQLPDQQDVLHVWDEGPYQQASRTGGYNHYQDCDRCGSRSHNTNECPTLWRMYEAAKATSPPTSGATTVAAAGTLEMTARTCRTWMTSRASPPHLACTTSSQALLRRRDKARQASPRDWEAAATFADGYGFVAPMEVGKQARRKDRARMERRARELEEADDMILAAQVRGAEAEVEGEEHVQGERRREADQVRFRRGGRTPCVWGPPGAIKRDRVGSDSRRVETAGGEV
ncbi:hypothetical protein A0H81_09792 [Grifola frondosa]|uniref:CCHC-type domain-containing protein n=1 Tax=Grifola frondosa TaxID=5627 RepID=A0A1C7M185_GRIFR|nr:hypothetical protein A0H81_09792 [Grifola frondosa]